MAKRFKKAKKVFVGSEDEVVSKDVTSLLRNTSISPQVPTPVGAASSGNPATSSLPEKFSEIEVRIADLSSSGDGLGLKEGLDFVFIVPFTVPGDHVLVRIIKHFPEARYFTADFVKLLKAGPQRYDDLVRCRYFSKCAGCQFQMLSYGDQLQHKRRVVEKAYTNFSGLAPEVLPPVAQTMGSPMQYGYRTKLTPHFDGPPGFMSKKARKDPSTKPRFTEVPLIGFQEKGRGKTLDIEDCPIGTAAVRQGLQEERKRIASDFSEYTKGVTLLLRESTTRERKGHNHDQEKSATKSPNGQNPLPNSGDSENHDHESIENTNQAFTEVKTCIKDPKATSIEYIDDHVFKNTAGAFFQNNNSILPSFTAYIRKHIIPGPTAATTTPNTTTPNTTTPNTTTPNTTTPTTDTTGEDSSSKPIQYLIDAYCGSGLFTVTLSALFKSSLGIDIADASIVAARENATANKIENADFMTADAAKLFEKVQFPPDETAVVIDPPRKGCDEAFLRQLLLFGPKRVIYVSCNVHTQARDVGVLVEGLGQCRYKIESLQGFDFFPQTSHVEGVAVLSRSDKKLVKFDKQFSESDKQFAEIDKQLDEYDKQFG